MLRHAGKGLPVLDQGLNSASNFLLVVVAANLALPDELVAFGVFYASFGLILALSRSYFGTSILLNHRGGHSIRRVVVPIARTGTILSSIYLVGTLLLQPSYWQLALLFALAIPPILVQDSLRHVLIAENRNWPVILSDGAWLVVVLAGAVFATSLEVTLTSWVLGGGIALCILTLAVARFQGVAWDAQDSPSTTGKSWAMSVRSGADMLEIVSLLTVSSQQCGDGCGATIQAFVTLTAPLSLLTGGVALAATPYIRDVNLHTAVRFGLLQVLLIAIAGCMWAGLLGTGAFSLGERLVGSYWPSVASLLWMMPIAIAAVGFDAAGVNLLRVFGTPGQLPAGALVALVVFWAGAVASTLILEPISTSGGFIGLAYAAQYLGGLVAWVFVVTSLVAAKREETA